MKKKIKLHINWRKIVLFLLVSAGLVYLTRSLLMSIGIVLLLFAIDAVLENWEFRRETKKIFQDLKDRQEK